MVPKQVVRYVARSALPVHARIALGLRHPIPLLFYGAPFVKAGTFAAPATQQDIAPTIGTMIGAPPLPTYTGRVLRGDRCRRRRPRVVTVMVLDAMRADYFDKHAAVMPTLTRMRKEGAWFSQARTVDPADRHRCRPCQHRHRQRAPLSRHRRQQPVQPRHRQVAGSIRQLDTRELMALTDWRVDNRLDGEPAPEIRAILYRVALEALTNVRKHADAGLVEVLLERRGVGVAVRVRDDGAGFDLPAPTRRPSPATSGSSRCASARRPRAGASRSRARPARARSSTSGCPSRTATAGGA